MRRVNLYVVGGLLLGLGVGFLAGVLFVRHQYSVQAGALDAEWETWHYPGAVSNGSNSAGARGLLNLSVAPARSTLLATPDSFEDVMRFYAGKAGLNWATAGTSGAQSARTGLLDGESLVYMTDSTRLGDGQPRPVRLQTLGRRTVTYDVAVIVSRAEGEGHTHVVLLWFPRR